MLTMEALAAMESGNPDISATWMANGLAMARLLFDMAHSDVLFPSRVEFGDPEISYEMSETIKKVLNG